VIALMKLDRRARVGTDHRFAELESPSSGRFCRVVPIESDRVRDQICSRRSQRELVELQS
jgi:hypothetical protein